jgi:hypothetical protein
MHLTGDQLRAIGKISVRSAQLELYTHTLACGLVNPNLNVGWLAFEGDMFASMLRRVNRLSKEVSRENRELGARIREWATKAGDVQRRRNEVLHAYWILDEPTGEMIAVRLTRQNLAQAQTRVDELDRLAGEIEDVTVECISILKEVLGHDPGHDARVRMQRGNPTESRR